MLRHRIRVPGAVAMAAFVPPRIPRCILRQNERVSVRLGFESITIEPVLALLVETGQGAQGFLRRVVVLLARGTKAWLRDQVRVDFLSVIIEKLEELVFHNNRPFPLLRLSTPGMAI